MNTNDANRNGTRESSIQLDELPKPGASELSPPPSESGSEFKDVPTSESVTSFATRAGIKSGDGIGTSKLVLLGGGLAVAVLFFVFTAIVGKSPKRHISGKPSMQQAKQLGTKPPAGSVTPIMESVRTPAPDNAAGQLGPTDILRTRSAETTPASGSTSQVVSKSEAATLRRIAFGFNADEGGRAERAATYDTPSRQSFYPLVEWGWTRQDCIEYLRAKLGIVWMKSACVQCPFNALKEEALARHKEHPEQVADAMMLEHVSLSLNPRGTLYRNQSLIEITDAAGNALATDSYRQRLDTSLWAIYRVRRIYLAGKDKEGNIQPDRKGTAMRAVERLTGNIARSAAIFALRRMATPADEFDVRRGISYVYRRRCQTTYPTREEFLVAAPGVVETKARYGLDWFERRWENPQGSLFE